MFWLVSWRKSASNLESSAGIARYAVVVLPGEQAASERTPRHGAEADARVDVGQAELDLVALEHVVFGLLAYRRYQIELARHRVRFLFENFKGSSSNNRFLNMTITIISMEFHRLVPQ